MLELESRGVVVSLSVLSGCILLYNAWGPILAVIVSLFLVIYACYSLITNDSLLSPHAFIFFEYFKEAVIELKDTLGRAIVYVVRQLTHLWNKIKNVYRERFSVRMERRRISRYQLSSDTTFNSRNTPRFSLIPQLSPISRTAHKNTSNVSNISENKFNHDNEYQSFNQNNIYNKYTSTPISQYKKDDMHNIDARYKTNWSSPKKTSPMFNQNHTLTRGENSTLFSPDGSPWGTSISPKMRSKAGGVKTVQTVAGPLLASTRYNIDPKTYTDVTSPGLTIRLTKYAAEANNKLTHQSQYGTGQFPKVNLHASPIPLINAKSAKIRGPVTVRIAPPETTRYSPPERQKVLSGICQSENKSPSSVAQVLREISLKRHASKEDVTSDLVKKQRTDGIFVNEVENFEETKQKRGRDESSKSEEDNSPPDKNLRPTKRSKTPSCYDILCSLSSSIHVATGIKRKAVDCSRSGTSDFEKHFKSLEHIQNGDSRTLAQVQNINANDSTPAVNKKLSTNSNLSKSLNKTQEQSPIKGILKNSRNTMNSNDTETISANEENMRSQYKDNETSIAATKFTDKLFMRAEPQRNEKLRSLVEEQGNIIETKFTTDDAEEIKKKDIVNMRQTSMRARLQSMFDAISGKAASRINPDVVIQAEEIGEVAPAISSSADCATLNSVTTTTNVNTTPITTSAIVPALTSPKSNIKTVKHITFNLPNTENVSGTNQQITSNSVSDEKNKLIINSDLSNCKTDITQATSSVCTNVTLATNALPIISNSVTSTFVSGKSLTNTLPTVASATPLVVPSVASNGILKSNTSILNTSLSSTSPASTIILSIPSTSNNLFTNKNTISNITTTISNSDQTNTKSNIGNSILHNVSNTGSTMNTESPKFTFGNIVNTTASTQVNTGSAQNVTTSSLNFTTETKNVMLPMSTVTPTVTNVITTATTVTTVASSVASVFKSITDNATNTTNKNSMTSTATTTIPFIFGSNNVQTSKTEVGLFNTTTSNVPITFRMSVITQSNPIASNASIITNNTSAPSNPMLNLTNGTFSGNVSSGSTTFTLSTATPIFSFGTSNASTSENKSAFSYNANALGSSSGLLASTNTPVTSTTSNNTTSGFNVPTATTTSQFSTTTTSIFNTTSTAATFRTTTSEPVFGQAIAAPLFGNSPKSPFVPIQPTKSSIEFGTNNNNNNNNNNTFKEEKPAFGTNTNTVFGSSSTPLFSSQTTAAPTFGSPSVSTSALNFGSTNTTTAVFGAQNLNAPGNVQTSTSHSFGTPSPMFGNQNNPAPLFGSTTTTPVGTFNNTPMQNTFGSQNSTTMSFGATNNSNAFGDNKTLPFGIQTTVAPVFGTNKNNTNSIFTFGGNQDQQQQSTFSFGNNNTSNNNVSTTGSVPFQFGASTSKPVTGFNFTPRTTTPSINFGTSGTPSFNAPTPGMFSIGSGSTAPRSRTVRGRKPR
ncbi:mucin-5AC-like isoform X1 [Vespa crabro]|uniref:mucin-5AC-like isoform X1 n=1 Tax=Vespa crabro TaxID=7445 RepID=UPI001F02518B|nr:mucin-5AC-like isoform X1 [Vespa crabro]